ncbi:hypothetical protein SAMN05444166_2471 [Singulisphaera sp. GP187]|nr:hypothetical protein SAMN05444166_2471 [Singulisphaera sp. GP187]
MNRERTCYSGGRSFQDTSKPHRLLTPRRDPALNAPIVTLEDPQRKERHPVEDLFKRVFGPAWNAGTPTPRRNQLPALITGLTTSRTYASEPCSDPGEPIAPQSATRGRPDRAGGPRGSNPLSVLQCLQLAVARPGPESPWWIFARLAATFTGQVAKELKDISRFVGQLTPSCPGGPVSHLVSKTTQQVYGTSRQEGQLPLPLGQPDRLSPSPRGGVGKDHWLSWPGSPGRFGQVSCNHEVGPTWTNPHQTR